MKKRLFKLIPILVLFSAVCAEAADVTVIPVNGEIDRSLTVFIRRSIEKADNSGADTIIFEIDTFGGLVESALQIATLIGNAEQHTIAYIPAAPETTGVSWSAGALISFACNEIYMAPGTSIGAAAPVYSSAEGMKAAEEKTVSAVRGQMAALAEKNGYPKAAALAMVDADTELSEYFINDIPSLASAEELPQIQTEAEANGKAFRIGKTVSKPGKLLTLTANEMAFYRISSGTAESRTELLQLEGIEADSVETAESSLPDSLIALITGSALTTLLVIIGLAAVYIEITSPGFGIPGTVAIIVFSILFASNAMLGNVGSLEILLFLAGVALLAVEIFIIPGFGAAGISGIVLIAVGLVLAGQDFVLPEVDWQYDLFKQNIINVGIGTLGSIILVGVIFLLFPRIGVFNRLVLKTEETPASGFTVQKENTDSVLIGKTGTAATNLRPAGKADINGELITVESSGEYIEKGTVVTITGVNGNRIIASKADMT